MQKSDEMTKASKSSPRESEARTKRRSERTTGTVLSEVTLNIGNVQDYESLSVRKRSVQDAEVISEKEQENVHERSQVEMRHSHTNRSNSREVTPTLEKADEEEHLKDERRDSPGEAAAMVDVNRSSSKQEKVLHKDESTEHAVRGEYARNYECQNCKDMQSEIKNLTARMRDLQKELKQRFKTEKYIVESLSRKGKDKEGKKYPTEAKEIDKDKSQWKASYEELEGKIEELRKEMAIQRDHYQKTIEENRNEREQLETELSKKEDEINTLEKAIEKVDEENLRSMSIVQEMRSKSAKQIEEERKKIMQSIELNQLAKQELHRSNEAMISRLQTMIKQTCADNAELYIHLEKAGEIRKSRKFQAMGPEEFHQELEQRLNELLGRLKNEAKRLDMRWIGEQNIRHTVDNFEAMIKTILEDNPTFHSLAERLATFIKQTQSSEGRIQKESNENQRAKALMNFEKSFSKDIYLSLEQLRKIQNKELLESTQKIMKHLGDAEQRIDDSFIKRIENMSDIVAVIDSKQCNVRKIEQELDHNITLVKTSLNKMTESGGRVRSERRKSDMEILRGENRKLKEACSYLGDGYMRIERRIKNMEKQNEQLRYRSFTPLIGRRSTRGGIPEDKENEQHQERPISQRETGGTSDESLP